MKKLMMTSDEYYHRHDNDGCSGRFVALIGILIVGLILILR